MDGNEFKQFKKIVENNKNEISDNIKLLLYKIHPDLFNNIDFNDDDVFLEPLLIAALNRQNKTTNIKSEIEEILQGYFLNTTEIEIKHSFNKNSIAYIPNIGYFKENQLKVHEPILKCEGFEIIKEIHPFFKTYFNETEDGHIVNGKPAFESVWSTNYKELVRAISIIKQYLPNLAEELTFANKKIVLHNNSKILNFTTIETLGMLYFYVLGSKNLIYYIEELIHQGGHNYLYYVVHKRKDYFKIDVENRLLRDFSKQQWDNRTIYGAFHGLYTVTQRLVYFDKLLSLNVFKGREKHELLGRLIDNTTRFRTGLHLVKHQDIFTKKGVEFYKKLEASGDSILRKYEHIKKETDLSNAKIDFRYDKFCELNPFEEFSEKEKNNYYQF